MSSKQQTWYVYILECKDGSLYTGITTDLVRRLNEHQQKQGAKYTQAHGVRALRYREECTNRSDACKREAEIKRYSRAEKLHLATLTHERSG